MDDSCQTAGAADTATNNATGNPRCSARINLPAGSAAAAFTSKELFQQQKILNLVIREEGLFENNVFQRLFDTIFFIGVPQQVNFEIIHK